MVPNKEIQAVLLAELEKDPQRWSVIHAFAGAGMSIPPLWLIKELVETQEDAGHDQL